MNKTILNKYSNLKVLVTGATGFKGSWLLFWLKKLNSKVLGIGLSPEKNNILFKNLKIDKPGLIKIQNINEFNDTYKIIRIFKPDLIFHLAAQSIVSLSVKDPLNTFNTNIIGSANILKISRELNIPVVIITSDKCYQNNEWIWAYRENDKLGSSDPYSASKACVELVFNSFLKTYYSSNKFLKIATARAGNVIGGGDMKLNRVIPDIFRSIFKKEKAIFLRNPKSTRPWQHIFEPLYGYMTLGIHLLENKFKTKQIIPNWNFGPDTINCKNVEYVTKYITNYLNLKIKIKKKPIDFLEQNLLMLDNTKAEVELNWRPKLDINKSLELTSDWYISFFSGKNMYNFSNLQIEDYENL